MKWLPVTTRCLNEKLPWWGGIMWFGFGRRVVWIAPIPFNLLFRLLYAGWCWLKHPFRFFDAGFECEWFRHENAKWQKGYCAKFCVKRTWKP